MDRYYFFSYASHGAHGVSSVGNSIVMIPGNNADPMPLLLVRSFRRSHPDLAGVRITLMSWHEVDRLLTGSEKSEFISLSEGG